MYYTNDPVADAERYYADREKQLESRPICEHCGEHITDDFMFEINGFNVHEDCITDYCKENCKVQID